MIDPTIEQTLAPSKQEWKDGAIVGKTIAFLTSAALAWGLLILALAVTYVFLKMPKSQPAEPVTMMIEPIPQPTRTAPTPKRQKSANENIARQTINTPAMPSFDGVKTPEKKPVNDDGFTSQFDQDLSKFEAIIKKELP